MTFPIPFDDILTLDKGHCCIEIFLRSSWLLGLCNYRCSYCWPYARSDRKDLDPPQLVPTIDEPKDKQEKTDPIRQKKKKPVENPLPGYLDIPHSRSMM